MTIDPMGGGTFGRLYSLETIDGAALVAKTAAGDSTLETEGWMLGFLRSRSDLPVPDILHCDGDLLLMTRLPDDGNLNETAQEHAAELIASLHSVSDKTFGLGRNTVIGPLPQDNAPTEGWVDFFRDQRLVPMARQANDAGALPDGCLARMEGFCARLGKLIEEPAHPSLLHGDLWTGNVLSNDGRISGFIDPAIYFGHAEMDLAFSTLFQTFGDPFFDRYSEIQPIAPGFFETRRDIYNLWPLLVHARLFGGHYGASVDSILKHFI